VIRSNNLRGICEKMKSECISHTGNSNFQITIGNAASELKPRFQVMYFRSLSDNKWAIQSNTILVTFSRRHYLDKNSHTQKPPYPVLKIHACSPRYSFHFPINITVLLKTNQLFTFYLTKRLLLFGADGCVYYSTYFVSSSLWPC